MAVIRAFETDASDERQPGPAEALHDSDAVRKFCPKLMRVPGLTVCGGRAGRRPRSWPARTPGDWWRIVLVGPVLLSDAQSGVPGSGVSVGFAFAAWRAREPEVPAHHAVLYHRCARSNLKIGR
jgi:hypothetical protein